MNARASVSLAFALVACHAPAQPTAPSRVVLAAAPQAKPSATNVEPAPVAAAQPSSPAEAPALIDERPLDPKLIWSDDLNLRQGVSVVTGSLPAEVVQRIVRQHFGGVRACVQRAEPSGQISLTATFHIDRSGAAGRDAKVQTDPRDSKLGECVAALFRTLSFPQPEGGSVAVTYPIIATREVVSNTAAGKQHGKKGTMWGDSIGRSFGARGLGLSGRGAGGGGHGEGICLCGPVPQ